MRIANRKILMHFADDARLCLHVLDAFECRFERKRRLKLLFAHDAELQTCWQ